MPPGSVQETAGAGRSRQPVPRSRVSRRSRSRSGFRLWSCAARC